MRKLYVTRGVPGSGKSTLLEACGLTPYTLSPDTLRLAMSAPVLDEQGRMSISTQHDRRVWELLREILEERMERGELIVIDATHTTARYYNDYAQLAYRHRYEMYIIDLSDIPLEQARQQNIARSAYKIVADKALVDMHKRLAQLPYPKGWKVLKTPEDIRATLTHAPLDFSQFSIIHHIGDIQGCFTPLAKYFEKYPLRDDEAYVFVGDLLDRGPENDRVLDFVSRELAAKPNVFFVEGNHDLYIWQWLNGWPVKTREFNGRTRSQLEAAELDKSAIRSLLRGMMPALHYRYHDKDVLVTHGGLSTLPANLPYLSARQCIRGVGTYEEVGQIDDAFMQNTSANSFQIHGHRNKQSYPTQYNERCFNLEGKVEFGGELRAVQLSHSGFQAIEIPHSVMGPTSHSENANLVRELRANRLISERTLPENISSFHFKPEVMFKKKWTKQTTTTRGLFIHTLTNEIVIRGYDKFFNVNETRQTSYVDLEKNFSFPVKAWVKENGYLGLVGYDDCAGDLVISSKSTTEGEFADWFRALFEKTCGAHRQYLIDYLRSQNVCLVFEVILPAHDPHIIDYHGDHMVLLDIIKRQKDYEALPQVEREALGKHLGVRTKHCAATLPDWQSFERWYKSVQGIDYQYDGAYIEGFVLEDSAGWHVKLKLDYYTFWKQMRSALDALKKGKTPKTPSHCTYPDEAARVIAYMQTLPTERLANLAITDVRRAYASLT
ncbi:MAG: RNA ligase [Candidatus Saccharimonadales bacterium]